MTDPFTSYETGMKRLLEQLGCDHPRYAEALTFQARLGENVAQARLYGDENTLKNARAQIVHGLNCLALEAVGVSFHELLPDQLASTVVTSTNPIDLFAELVEWKLIHNESQMLLNALNIPFDYLTSYRFKPDPEKLHDAGYKWQELCVSKLKACPDKWNLQYAYTPALDDLQTQTLSPRLNEITRQLMRITIHGPEFNVIYLQLAELKGTLWNILNVADKRIMVLIEALKAKIGE